MANTGTLTATVSALSGVNSLTMAWTAVQDQNTNTSTFSYTLTAGGGSSYYRRIKSIAVKAKNSNASGWSYSYAPGYNAITYGGTEVVNSSFTLAHNSDGTLDADIELTAQFWDGSTSSYRTGTASDTATIDSIAMQSALSVTPALLTSGNNLIIALTRSVSSYLDKVVVKVEGTTLYTYQLADSDYTDNVATITKSQADIVTDSGLATGLTASITVESSTYTDNTYSEQVGTTQTATVTLSTGAIPLSLYYKNNKYGAAIGKRATATDVLDIAYDTTIDGTLTKEGANVDGWVTLWTGKLAGGNTTSFDMSDYKRLRIYGMSRVVQNIFELDLTTVCPEPSSSGYPYEATGVAGFYANSRWESHFIQCGVNSAKSTFNCMNIGYSYASTYGLRNGSTYQANYHVYRIDGIK